MNIDSPIVIGGTGGSGTRVVQTIIEQAGAFMGSNLNGAAKDAQEFEPYLDETINQLISCKHKINYSLQELPSALVEERVGTFRKIAEQYRNGVPANSLGWGWKNPRSIYILPIIHAVFPNFRFIHVVRDGRDMAVSENQNQLRKHYQALFGEEPQAETAVSSIKLWSHVNTEMAAWGEATLGSHYLRVRFEDLCNQPQSTITSLLKNLGYLSVDAHPLVRFIETPSSLGRHRSLDQQLLTKIHAQGDAALKKFGYC